ncbi:MAG: DNA replication and repair protein RecF [Sphingomonadales bacterium]|nr:DNA replication and repair protein RecF [Sphingomonadales bacterium]
MKLQQLTLANFRLTEQASYEFRSKLTAITGANGRGKTNLIDAVHYLCLARSYFHPHDERLMRFGASYLWVDGQFDRAGQTFRIHGAWRPGEKGFRCDGKAYGRLSDHVGRFPAVMIAPIDINLIHEGGEQRRRLMDLTLSQEDPNYLEDLSRYNRLLRQKQAVLRGWQTTGRGDKHLLRVLTDQMHPLNLCISRRRRQWTAQMTTLFADNYRHISGGHEVPSLEYRPGWPLEAEQTASASTSEISAALGISNSHKDANLPQNEEGIVQPGINKTYNDDEAPEPIKMEQMLQQEKSSGRCLWGIHRDDLQFCLDGHPLRPHASQGQQKTYVISLKLAQAELIRQATGTQPILLLDDVFEKLDEQRVAALLDRVSAEPYHQILLTHTEQDRVRAMLSGNIDADYIAL